MKQAPKNHEQEGKPDAGLIPFDLLLKVLEPAYQEGLLKYYRESWRLGFPTSVMYASCLRHLSAFFFDKEDFDSDAEKLGIKKTHLGGAMFALICMYDTFINHPEMDDRGKDYSMEVCKLKGTIQLDIEDELFQCPYSEATKCTMNEPCNGCETWAKKLPTIQKII